MNSSRDDHSGPVMALRVLRRRLVFVVGCALLAGAVALGFSLTQQKEYSASASLLFRDPQFDQKLFGSTVFAPTSDPTREAATNVRLVSLEVVAARTARALHSGVAPSAVQDKVSINEQGQSDVVSITATDNNRYFAARLANTFAEQYIAFRRGADTSKIASTSKLVHSQLQRLPKAEQAGAAGRSLRDRAEQLQILGSLQTGNAELVQPATPPSSPSSPKPVRNAAVGLMFGLLLGVGLALIRERFDRRLKDPKEIAEAFDRPMLGGIPESRTIASTKEGLPRLGAAEAEAFRMLRANLRYFNVDHQIDSVLITSAVPADGKSTVAMHLASAAASTGSKVLLVEADLRHPTMARRLGLRPDRGLSQLLADESQTIESVAHRVPVTGRRSDDEAKLRYMHVLASGPIPPNPTDLIESDRMHSPIRTAEPQYDLVVIDTPPTSVVSDAIPHIKQVSGVIVVSRLGKTTKESASHLRSQLTNLEANTLGVVVNSVGRQSGYYGYAYAYGYATAAEQAKHDRSGEPLPEAMPLANREPDFRADRRRGDSDNVARQGGRVGVVEQDAPNSTNGAGGAGDAAKRHPSPPSQPEPRGGLLSRRRRKNPPSPPGVS